MKKLKKKIYGFFLFYDFRCVVVLHIKNHLWFPDLVELWLRVICNIEKKKIKIQLPIYIFHFNLY
jgi:hypothetical protein